MPKESTAAKQALGDFAPKLVELTDRVLFDDVRQRPELGLRDRSLVTCAALVATGRTEQPRFHLPRAVENGVSRDELVEMITHLEFYAGWPSAMSAVQLAKELFEAGASRARHEGWGPQGGIEGRSASWEAVVSRSRSSGSAAWE